MLHSLTEVELGLDMTGERRRCEEEDLSSLKPTTGEVGMMAAADTSVLSFLLVGVLHIGTEDTLGVDTTSVEGMIHGEGLCLRPSTCEVGERMVGEDMLRLVFLLVVLHDTTADTLGLSKTSEDWVIVDLAGFNFFTFTLHFLMGPLTSGFLFSFPTNFPNSSLFPN